MEFFPDQTGSRLQQRIAALLYPAGELTRSALSQALGVSLPTLTKALSFLIQKGVLREQSSRQRTGGRIAKTLSLNPSCCCSLTVQPQAEHATLTLTDLALRQQTRTAPLPRQDSAERRREIGAAAHALLAASQLPKDGLVGVTVLLPDHADAAARAQADELRQFLGSQLGAEAVVLECFTAAGYACTLPGKSAAYLSLGQAVQALVVRNGQAERNSAFPHMTLRPDAGTLCDCGRPGCFAALCSTAQLWEGPERQEAFLSRVKAGTPPEAWTRYLSDLSAGLDCLQSLLGLPVVLNCGFAEALQAGLPAAYAACTRRSLRGVCIIRADAGQPCRGAALYHIQRVLFCGADAAPENVCEIDGAC